MNAQTETQKVAEIQAAYENLKAQVVAQNNQINSQATQIASLASAAQGGQTITADQISALDSIDTLDIEVQTDKAAVAGAAGTTPNPTPGQTQNIPGVTSAAVVNTSGPTPAVGSVPDSALGPLDTPAPRKDPALAATANPQANLASAGVATPVAPSVIITPTQSEVVNAGTDVGQGTATGTPPPTNSVTLGGTAQPTPAGPVGSPSNPTPGSVVGNTPPPADPAPVPSPASNAAPAPGTSVPAPAAPQSGS